MGGRGGTHQAIGNAAATAFLSALLAAADAGEAGWSFGCLETSAQAEAHATSVLKILTEFAMVAILTVDLARSCTATFSAP